MRGLLTGKEQDAIEDVAKRLCGKKLDEKGDLAV
jgi:hypothetical protein